MNSRPLQVFCRRRRPPKTLLYNSVVPSVSGSTQPGGTIRSLEVAQRDDRSGHPAQTTHPNHIEQQIQRQDAPQPCRRT